MYQKDPNGPEGGKSALYGEMKRVRRKLESKTEVEWGAARTYGSLR